MDAAAGTGQVVVVVLILALSDLLLILPISCRLFPGVVVVAFSIPSRGDGRPQLYTVQSQAGKHSHPRPSPSA